MAILPIVKHGVQGDLKIGLLVLKTGIEGSLAVAKINISLIQDDTVAKKFQTRIDEIRTKFEAMVTELQAK
ncbi:cyclodeaminase/cyclohydrolase family protein [Sporomusa aerivorans]|uniref:cyclodeaminase/cyclohydrolase family protein n=1 Tax=Sporomusa aerivorans TaxID=204936 RepID=UPI00352A43A9